jgi:hypothetical protein
MARKAFRLDATETFAKWLETKCGADAAEALSAVIEGERSDVGRAIERRLPLSRHYHNSKDPELGHREVLTAGAVINIIRQESGLVSRA